MISASPLSVSPLPPVIESLGAGAAEPHTHHVTLTAIGRRAVPGNAQRPNRVGNTCWVQSLRITPDTLGVERWRLGIIYAKGGETVSLRTFIEDEGARLKQLLSRLSALGMSAFRFPKVHPSEISKEVLEMLGFRPAGAHLLCAARARSE